MPTVESKFSGYQSMVAYPAILYSPRRKKYNVNYGMGRLIFTIHRPLYWWKNYSAMGWKKGTLSKSTFYGETETWDPLIEKETV